MTPTSSHILELVNEIKQRGEKGDDELIAIAKKYGELRHLIEEGAAGPGIKWFSWARNNIGLSPSRLCELQAIAEAKYPKSALEHYRRKNRERQKRYVAAQRERDPERIAVIRLIRTIDIEHVRKVRKHLLVLTGE